MIASVTKAEEINRNFAVLPKFNVVIGPNSSHECETLREGMKKPTSEFEGHREQALRRPDKYLNSSKLDQ